MCERRGRAEKRDGHRLLQRQGAGHNFPINCAQRFLAHGPFVQPGHALKHSQFAVRRVNLLALLELEHADFEHVPGSLVQQSDNLLVEVVDGFAVLGNVHEG